MTGTAGSARLVRRSGIISRRINDETVLLDTAGQRYLSLNLAGSYLWDQLAEPRTFDLLLEGMIETFDADAHVLRADLEAFIDDLTAKHLIDEL